MTSQNLVPCRLELVGREETRFLCVPPGAFTRVGRAM